MTLVEFFRDLKLSVPQSAWHITDQGQLRATYDNERRTDCPITALCFWRDAERFTVANVKEAAKYLGLGETDMKGIVSAADWYLNPHMRLHWALVAATTSKQSTPQFVTAHTERDGNE